jgi:acetyl-CoA carboxylase biotin carboxylase subunit
LDTRLRKRICDAAVKAAKAVNYSNAGTVEFILAPDGEFYFMEMNTRLQIEHCVTEVITGLDLVKWQIKIAAGQKLDVNQRQVKWSGHGIEARITARDPERDFAPCAGHIASLHLPGGPNVRVDTQVYSGSDVSPYYDPMVAKIIVWDTTRDAAIAKMQRALNETLVNGISTDLPYLKRIVANPYFKRADLSTSFLQLRMVD